jgi:hypothetical protein
MMQLLSLQANEGNGVAANTNKGPAALTSINLRLPAPLYSASSLNLRRNMAEATAKAPVKTEKRTAESRLVKKPI